MITSALSLASGNGVWNVMYDDFLRLDLPAGTSIIGFAVDALVVCAADDVKILELRINDSLWRAKRWLDSRCLKMTPEKTETLLVTDRRSFKYPRIVHGEHEIEWKKRIKYLGVQLDQRLSFGEHLQIATAKAIQCGVALTRLMPNIGGPRKAKRRLVASVVNSNQLNTAPVWTSAPNKHAIQEKLFSAQRGEVLRIVSAYRTVSTSAVLVLESVPPIDLLAEERKETFRHRKELTCLTNLQEIARVQEAIRKDETRRLVEKWQMRWHCDQSGRWTHRLIPEIATWLDRKHGQVGFYLAQAFSDHGCFNAYLKYFKKRDDKSCRYCGSLVENAEHTLCLCQVGRGKGGCRSDSGRTTHS